MERHDRIVKWFNKNKKKMNKGFTLVELIVVIAILAILMGLLAPQYTKYVEKSRKAADLNNLDNLVNAIKVAAADPEYHLGSNTEATTQYIITIGTIYNVLEKFDGMTVERYHYQKGYDQVAQALNAYSGLVFQERTTESQEISWIDNYTIKLKSHKWGNAQFTNQGLWQTDSGIAAHIILDNSTGSITVTYSDNVVNYLDHGTID